MSKDAPIALEAYERLAEAFSARAEYKAENAYIEQPAIRSMLGSVYGLTILEAGCGPGILAQYLLSSGASSLTGFDISPKMIEFAGRRLGDMATLHIADLAQPLQFASDSEFDLVVSSLAIDYVRNWAQPFSEFRRVLKPKGRLVFSVQHPQSAFEWYQPPSAFGVHPVQATWEDFGGEPVVVPDYYRSFGEMINPLVTNGFHVSRLVECRPVSDLLEHDPVLYEKYLNRPTFMVFEAVLS